MKTNDENSELAISHSEQIKFQDYDFKKIEGSKVKTQKHKQTGESSVATSKAKPVLSKNGSQFNLTTLLAKPNKTTNNFLKKNRRMSQERVVY